MATDAQPGLAAFHQYIGEHLRNGGSHLSPEEALEEWRLLHPDAGLHAENVKAIKAALRDMEAGDRGIPFEDHLREIREEFDLTGGE